MFGRLKRIFSKPKPWKWSGTARQADSPAKEPASASAINLRRWESGKTNRLNSAHWTPVTGQTINQDLKSYLETIRTRAEFEVATNSLAEGAINTHQVDMVGENGPLLQVLSDNPDYNAKLEEVWADFWENPDINGQLPGPELLKLWLRTLWTAGEFVAQVVTDRSAKGTIRTRLHNLNPRRLGTLDTTAIDDKVIMGVERTATGKPIAYHIDKSPETDLSQTPKVVRILAKNIIHEFHHLEAGQARGIPWLSASLQDVADLRDYDNEVLDAARAAADSGNLIHTTHPDVEPVVVEESCEIERRTNTVLPPGYTATQMTPQQPSTQYNDYHDELVRRLGSYVAMPLMIIKHDSRKHNYSSARFDDQGYNRANKTLQGWLARRVLNRLVEMVATEAERAGVLKRPERVKYKWTWPARPHVDDQKEAKGSSERLANCTSSLRDECAALGKDWEELIEQQGREKKALEAQELPSPFGRIGKGLVGEEDDGDDDQETTETKSDERLAYYYP
ncbi:MAG: phage portal protein [Phycisphaerales bacterium]|nr:MAG: phage portal protein [Phycisphaerales bacterium]